MTPCARLNNGVMMPELGLGTWQLPESDQLVCDLASAIDRGFHYIDTAAIYGNQSCLGKALTQCKTQREDLFILSKSWTTNRTYDAVMRGFEETLRELDLDYLDAYLIHWPCTKGDPLAWQSVNIGTWRAFESLYEQKLVRAIGVSNFLPHHLVSFLARANIAPQINQIECHVGYPQQKCVQFCQANDIQVVGWSPLGHGHMIDSELVHEIADKHQKTAAQILLRWCLQNGVIPVTHTLNAQHQEENLAIFNFDLDEDDMIMLDQVPMQSFSGLSPDHVSF